MRPGRLQRPQGGGPDRAPAEGARGAAPAGGGVAAGARRPRRRPRRRRPQGVVPELEQAARLEEELKLALVERRSRRPQGRDRRDPAGRGGDEAALWAGDLYRMLTRYAERRGFKAEARGQPERRRRLQGGELRGQGRRRVLGVQVGRRHAPRPARPRDRVPGPDPHVDGDRRGHAGGRGGRGRDRPQRSEDRRLPLDRPGRAVREHDRLGRPDHAPPDRARRRHAGREVAAPEQARRRCACCAPGSTSRSSSGSARSWTRPAARRSAAASAPRRSAPTTSRRIASPTTGSS